MSKLRWLVKELGTAEGMVALRRKHRQDKVPR
jgi:hypothetical protein